MNVRTFMTREVVTGVPDDDLGTLAHRMWLADCGCIAVIDEHRRPIGMVTDRDICMAAMTSGCPLREIAARDAMSKPIWVVSEEDVIESAEVSMRAHRVRRLPVVDAAGAVVGVLSLDDIARHLDVGDHLPKPAWGVEAVAWTMAGIAKKSPDRGIVR